VNEDSRRGKQGVQGVQGIQGVEGEQGKSSGAPGAPGARGERGRTGSQPRSVILSFWAVVAVAFLVLAGFGYTISQNRAAIRENKRLSDARLDDRRRADYNLCAAVNESRDVLGDIIRGILKTTGGTGPGDDSRKAALKRLRPSRCPPKTR